jgi:hypothetical protein
MQLVKYTTNIPRTFLRQTPVYVALLFLQTYEQIWSRISFPLLAASYKLISRVSIAHIFQDTVYAHKKE